MKKLYFLFFLTIGFLGNAQNINFIDINFKNKLLQADVNNNIALDLLNNPIKIDSNNDGEINVLEAQNIKSLKLNNSNILSLDEIINFNNLEFLDLESNLLVKIDVSNNLYLQTLVIENNLNLVHINAKNGILSPTISLPPAPLGIGGLMFGGCSSVLYICVSESFIDDTLDYINFYRNLYNEFPNPIEVNSYCNFLPGGVYYQVLVNTKFDFNSNGCDVSDSNYSNLNFSITDGTNTGSLIANSTGNYYIPVQAGNHAITPNLENPSYFNISPTSFTVNFPTQTSPFNQDFCVTANGAKSDVEVMVMPTTPARPGFDGDYKLVYRNKGNQIENGSVSVTFDDTRLDYVSSNPVYDSAATNSFTWNYTNLQPFETREVEITFNVNSPMETPAVNNGDVLNYTITITSANTDETPTDNTFTLDQTVVGSYDPNDKTCLQGETIEPSEVGKYVHYVIRFENTGTFPAENIVVKDMIDLTKFDIATLVPLKSSHDFFTRISGNKVEFIFENINLDFNDATNDGYVAFKIKTKPTLVLGNTFTNNANIYFDYNFPITTNTYTTTVAALNTQDFDFGNYFTLYPNPAKDFLNIQTKQDLSVNSVEIYNQLGQIVLAVTNAVNTVDVANLASGTYFVKVNTEKGSANMKFVKE